MIEQRTVTIPAFLSPEQFSDPGFCQLHDLGPICTMFVPALGLGGWWTPDRRCWVLQCPIEANELVGAVHRWLTENDQLAAAVRHYRATERPH
jgi:hypothetical protein